MPLQWRDQFWGVWRKVPESDAGSVFPKQKAVNVRDQDHFAEARWLIRDGDRGGRGRKSQ